jgi:hypothetical protein
VRQHERLSNWCVKEGVNRASGTRSFTRTDVPGLKSWAIFTASLRDEDRESVFRRSQPWADSGIRFQTESALGGFENPISHGVYPLGWISGEVGGATDQQVNY